MKFTLWAANNSYLNDQLTDCFLDQPLLEKKMSGLVCSGAQIGIQTSFCPTTQRFLPFVILKVKEKQNISHECVRKPKTIHQTKVTNYGMFIYISAD